MRSRSSRKSSHKGLIISLVVALVVVAGGAAYFLFFRGGDGGTGTAGSSTSTTASRPDVTDPPVQIPTPAVAPVAVDSGKKPTEAGVAKRLAPILANKQIGYTYSGLVVDAATGKVLWKHNPGTPSLPASTVKILTGAAVLTSMDPNTRLVTKVVQGDQEGDIVFVGGGDVTLSARQTGVATVYDGAPTVADLAAQIKASGVQVKRILLDTSYWAGEPLAGGWQRVDIAGGYITNMEALMVDGDRTDPSNENSPRTGTPAKTAGVALARALGDANIPIVAGQTAPPDGKVIAQVRSQPVSVLLTQAMVNSDNILAEALGREVAIKRGQSGSFDGVAASLQQSVEDLKLDSNGLQLYDASGMSNLDKVPPSLLTDILTLAVNGKDPRLSTLLSGLPVAGVSGTLSLDHERFVSDASIAGRGWVRAKTGSLESTYGMAGYVPDVDGRMLVFALYSNGVTSTQDGGKTGTRAVQDQFATALRQCGCS